ncbi:MAG: hypothetical protein ACLTYN_01210 [Dysosmobacter welbionis]
MSCTVTRRETTLADVLDLLCRAYQAEFEQFSLGRGQESPFRYLSQAQYQGLVWQLLEQYGLFSGTPKDRYSDGRLDEILMEALSQERCCTCPSPSPSRQAAVLLWRLLLEGTQL